MVKKEYFIFVNGDKVMVSKEVYLAYWQHTNRENYLERLDRQNKLLFFVRPAWAQSKGLKSLVCPSSGKDIAEHQGCPSRGGI